MTINLIVAKGINNEIGKENHLLWHLSSEMSFFKETTIGHTVVMGRKTWESIGSKPLPNRTNVILSNTMEKGYRNYDSFSQVLVTPSTSKILRNYETYKKYNPNHQLFIIGGAQIYEEFAKYAEVLYITEVEQSFPEADTFFPKVAGGFTRVKLKSGEDNGLAYTIYKYEREY